MPSNKPKRPHRIPKLQLDTVQNLSAFIDSLIQSNLKGELNWRNLGAINGAIRNKLTVLTTQAAEPSQQTPPPSDMIPYHLLAQALRGQPLEVQEAIISELRRSRIQTLSNGQPPEVHGKTRVQECESPQANLPETTESQS